MSDGRDLRELWATSTRADGDEPAPNASGKSPVDPDLVWRAASGELDADELRSLADRLDRDPVLAREWALAVEAARTAADADGLEEVDLPRRGASRHQLRWGRTALAATAAAAVLGAAGWLWQGTLPTSRDGEEIVFRAEADEQIRPEVSEVLHREEPVLRWSGAPPDSLYDVLVSDRSLEVVARAIQIEEDEWRLPPEVVAELESGDELLWKVDALTPDGVRISSRTFRLVVE